MIGPDKSLSATANPYYQSLDAGNLGDKALFGNHMVGNTVLDMGTGDGNVAEHLRSQGFTVAGVDIAPREGVKNVTVSWMDRVHEKFPAESFDNVLFCSSLHEVFSFGNRGSDSGISGVAVTIASAVRLLKPGGRLIIRDGVKYDGRAAMNLLVTGAWMEMADIFAQNHPDFFQEEGDGYTTVFGSDIVEFMCTGVWGLDFIERESAERFGWATENEVPDIVGLPLLHKAVWSSPVYRDVWKRAGLDLWFDRTGEDVPWPMTHGLWVFEKEDR